MPRQISGLSFFLPVFLIGITSACKEHAVSPPPAIISEPVIYVINDIHYLAKSLHDNGNRYKETLEERDGKNREMLGPLLETLCFTLGREKPDILLVNGDLTYNGERKSHRALAKYLKRIKNLGIKVFVLPGNHDIENPWARRFFRSGAYAAASVSPAQFKSIYKDFGYDTALSADKESLSYIAEPVRGLRLFMLDSNKYRDNRRLNIPEAGGRIPDATQEWLSREAEKARREGVRVIAAMHHNVMDHHPMMNKGFTIENAESARASLARLGIPFVLSGHIHAQDIGARQTEAGTVYDIATGAFSVYPHTAGVLRVSLKESRWQYSAKALDVEAWANQSGSRDGRLLDFKAYSEHFFTRASGEMVKRRGASGLTEKETDELTRLLGILNARYFSGTEYLNFRDIEQFPGYALLKRQGLGFLSDYALSIMEDIPPSNIEVAGHF